MLVLCRVGKATIECEAEVSHFIKPPSSHTVRWNHIRDRDRLVRVVLVGSFRLAAKVGRASEMGRLYRLLEIG